MKIKKTYTSIAILLIALIVSCKQNTTFSDFKYTEKPETITCDNLNSALYKEALYAFEEDILAFYGKNEANPTLMQSYYKFIREANGKRARYSEIASEHTLKVFEALKDVNDLWDAKNPNSHLNYHSALMNCVANNIEDEHLKTTLNALISTDFMSPKLFATPLINNYRRVLSDKHLSTYVAFDLYYSNLFNLNKTAH
ncbi:hypothetical protein [Aestuariibaculum sediminum]|uniref:DUF4919 domain-containing protein n=1 Tax=Aestuariibaculum sediminum TaxID=2770637 RepID=A0A8J6Q973_9FLAO|nr:hypothetical protein [Aestuariibaculum sediminum]MBD0832227.1 hypothetical protein [Aestuariibaculum sediminum]